jgi:ubiquinone/menaquinone biosynthesis C-methylase UbiE
MENHRNQTHNKWTETDSTLFIDYGQIFVPERARQHEIISMLIPQIAPSTVIVDLCCGEGLLEKEIHKRNHSCEFMLFDGSSVMLEKAKENLFDLTDSVSYQQFDITDNDWRVFPKKPHAIVSSLAIHHLDNDAKVVLFADMYRELEIGGALLIADIIKPANALGIAVAAKGWDDAVYENSHGDLELYEYFKSVQWNIYTDPEPDEIDKPATIFSQLKWLEISGFKEVDVFWMKGGHVVFGGYKV